MGLSVEDLLAVRYKVIALFPGSIRSIGEVIYFQDLPGWPTKEYYEDFPHLFQKLQWWQERAESDMPEFVKWDHKGIPENDTVEKVEYSTKTWTMAIKVKSQVNSVKAEYFVPASLADYEQYLSSTDNKAK